MEDANEQTLAVIAEAFTFVGGDGTIFNGVFGDPMIMEVMTRDGYQDHLVTPLVIQRSQFANFTSDQLNALARMSLVRTQTGRTFFINVVDYTAVVVYKFILTDRQL